MRYDLEMGFSRGLYPGWFFPGSTTRNWRDARFGKKRGVYLGDVRRIHLERITISLRRRSRRATAWFLMPVIPIRRRRADGFTPLKNAERGHSWSFGHGDLDYNPHSHWRQAVENQRRGTGPPVAPDLRRGETTVSPADRVGSSRLRGPVDDDYRAGRARPMMAASGLRRCLSRVAEKWRVGVLPDYASSSDQNGRNSPLALGELKNHLTGAVILPVKRAKPFAARSDRATGDSPRATAAGGWWRRRVKTRLGSQTPLLQVRRRPFRS